jgi:RNA polymerase sigma-70 factor (ECF subfamily)
MNPELAETPEPDSRVVDALRALSPRDQALVVLFYFEDRPVSEAAEILEMSVGAAKVALHRARARLAQLLQVEVHDEPR